MLLNCLPGLLRQLERPRVQEPPHKHLEVVEGDRLLLRLAPEVLAVGEGGVRVLGGQRLLEVVPRVHPEDLDEGAVRQVQPAGAPAE